MEMARIANRMIERMTGRRLGRLIGRLVLGLALGAALTAAGCGRSLCPDGMATDSNRSKVGAGAFCHSRADQRRAAWLEFYRDTDRRQLCAYVDGRADGPYQAWHPRGQRWLEGHYAQGKKAGRWTQWAVDGRKVADGEYREGNLIEGAPVGFPATCEAVTW
jgi:hypothetical protein